VVFPLCIGGVFHVKYCVFAVIWSCVLHRLSAVIHNRLSQSFSFVFVFRNGTARARTSGVSSASGRQAPHPHLQRKKNRPPPTNSARAEDFSSSAPRARSPSPSPRARDLLCLSPHCPLAHPSTVVPTESDSHPAPTQRRTATITCMDLSAPNFANLTPPIQAPGRHHSLSSSYNMKKGYCKHRRTSENAT
jgi:hypothetical protein